MARVFVDHVVLERKEMHGCQEDLSHGCHEDLFDLFLLGFVFSEDQDQDFRKFSEIRTKKLTLQHPISIVSKTYRVFSQRIISHRPSEVRKTSFTKPCSSESTRPIDAPHRLVTVRGTMATSSATPPDGGKKEHDHDHGAFQKPQYLSTTASEKEPMDPRAPLDENDGPLQTHTAPQSYTLGNAKQYYYPEDHDNDRQPQNVKLEEDIDGTEATNSTVIISILKEHSDILKEHTATLRIQSQEIDKVGG